ncbi:MAG: hypothetical protein ACKVU1_17065 [bacterium]
MKCSEFESWLDEAMPAAVAQRARDHARGCARCATSLEAARAIESLLAAGGAPVLPSANFTDRVMTRVGAIEALHARSRAVLPSDPFAWWVRAAMDPASVLSLFLAALLVWQWDSAIVFARSATSTMTSINFTAALLSLTQIGGVVGHPALQASIVVVLVPAGLLLSFALYRLSERLLTLGAR